MNINQDLESQRIRRNLTKTQVKVVNSAREGAMINSNMPLSESYNSLLIADTVELPDKLYEKNTLDSHFCFFSFIFMFPSKYNK